jgi:hypothetical protein
MIDRIDDVTDRLDHVNSNETQNMGTVPDASLPAKFKLGSGSRFDEEGSFILVLPTDKSCTTK